ncbi:hypothetical protein SAMN02910447_02389 [Ruminococcus sp. YE71]|uniref:DNA-binding protein WhiA n=1 Tax=unclassified Ruminococcus TaxID=2608920 RepID=UPI000889699D|nr:MULTISPECIES: DNA-binding protein WhiA [unclassified Ruminococcus]SDA23849.1 hypothetical protein SAMN02910446_02256 [Ruminococcus sp. YE78]SFW40620.1 hypothetical protein SAMN02910447_02389 [Ruminococcus sp. YE71]
MSETMELSFSQRVKEEIISRINSSAKADACLYGLLLCTNILNEDEITLLTETVSVSEMFSVNVSRICGEGNLTVVPTERGGGTVMYSITVNSADARSKLLGYFRIGEGRQRLDPKYPKNSLLPFMIAGMYLASGSISDPNKGYHMEMALPDLELCNFLGLTLLEKYDMLAKHVERKNHQVLYFKESDNIIDMLALMGATSASFELTNVKIYKDMRNNINRGVNCVNANIEKSIRAAEKQIEDIELIDAEMGLDTLPDNLREIAMLRYENPDFNLADLGAALTPPISRSGANHRLQKIAKIADDIRRTKL